METERHLALSDTFMIASLNKPGVSNRNEGYTLQRKKEKYTCTWYGVYENGSNPIKYRVTNTSAQHHCRVQAQ